MGGPDWAALTRSGRGPYLKAAFMIGYVVITHTGFPVLLFARARACKTGSRLKLCAPEGGAGVPRTQEQQLDGRLEEARHRHHDRRTEHPEHVVDEEARQQDHACGGEEPAVGRLQTCLTPAEPNETRFWSAVQQRRRVKYHACMFVGGAIDGLAEQAVHKQSRIKTAADQDC